MPVFQRLERALSLIARHPYYPGKTEAVHDCLEDLEKRFLDGTLSQDEKSRLVAILAEEGSSEGAMTDMAMRPTRRS